MHGLHVFACMHWGGFWIQVRVGCWYVAGIMFQRGWLGARSAKCSLAALHHSSVRIAHWKMQSKCINTQHMTFKMHHYATHTTHENAIENCKTEIGKHLRKLHCVNAEYACRALIRKQLPGFESCRLCRLWWTFLVVAILANAVTAAVKYDDDCPEVDRDISIRKRVRPAKHLKYVYRRSFS